MKSRIKKALSWMQNAWFQTTSFIEKMFHWAYFIAYILTMFGGSIYWIYLAGPALSLIVTPLFAILVTIIAFTSRKTFAMSVVGIILYGISWLIASDYGQIVGGIVCLIGLITWLSAAMIALASIFRLRSNHYSYRIT